MTDEVVHPPTGTPVTTLAPPERESAQDAGCGEVSPMAIDTETREGNQATITSDIPDEQDQEMLDVAESVNDVDNYVNDGESETFPKKCDLLVTDGSVKHRKATYGLVIVTG